MDLIDNNGILEMPSDPKYEPYAHGFGALCFNKMKEFKNEIAQINADTNKYETYGEILSKSIRVAIHMKSFGVQDNDIITLCTTTHSEACLPFWASIFSGVKMANLDPTLGLNDMKYLCNLVKPKLIFCILECVEMLEVVIEELNLNTKLVVFGPTKHHIPFENFVLPQYGEKYFKPKIAKNLFDTTYIVFSSGTTGFPKGVCLTHYGILSQINICKDLFHMKNVLFYTSPYWISYLVIISTTLLSGGARILVKTFYAKNVLKLIHDYKITYMFIPPSYIYALTSEFNNSDKIYNTSSLQSIMAGGGIVGHNQIEKMKNKFPNAFFSYVYGLSEVTCLCFAFNPNIDFQLAKLKISSCGKILPGAICKVVDIKTKKVLKKYEKGELLIKTKREMARYYNDPIKTKEAYDEHGFLHTGDLVYYDDDYCFHVVDRIKEMFKYKSWHIVPAELENIIIHHPSVKEVLIIGYPNEEDGDHPMAIIILKENVNTTENDILQFYDNLVTDRQKLRAGVKFVKSLPRTATGKYNRMKLRTMIINNEI